MEFLINNVKSSVVKGIMYNHKKELTVQLVDRLYIYKNVPKKIAQEFLNANSKGKFFNENIKEFYEYVG
ncbi:MAG: KTSC domain-containing protein [Thermoplasmatales archaeon]